jgi:hypothetical protein
LKTGVTKKKNDMSTGPEKLNLIDSFHQVEDYFAPRIIGEVNDVFLEVARIKGDDIPWHKQDHARGEKNHCPYRRCKNRNDPKH